MRKLQACRNMSTAQLRAGRSEQDEEQQLVWLITGRDNDQDNAKCAANRSIMLCRERRAAFSISFATCSSIWSVANISKISRMFVLLASAASLSGAAPARRSGTAVDIDSSPLDIHTVFVLVDQEVN